MKNLVILIGRMTRDPELKESSSGKKYLKFTLAVNRGKDLTDFIDCTAFEKHAEILMKYTKKGSLLYLEGSLVISTYEKDGVKHKNTTVIANETTFLSSNLTTKESAKNNNDLNDNYVIPTGKYKGRRLSEISEAELNTLIDSIEAFAAAKEIDLKTSKSDTAKTYQAIIEYLETIPTQLKINGETFEQWKEKNDAPLSV